MILLVWLSAEAETIMNPDDEEDLIEAEIQQQLKNVTLVKNGMSQSDEHELEEELDEVQNV